MRKVTCLTILMCQIFSGEVFGNDYLLSAMCITLLLVCAYSSFWMRSTFVMSCCGEVGRRVKEGCIALQVAHLFNLEVSMQ